MDPDLKHSLPDMSILMILAPHNFWMTIGEPCAQDCWILPGVFSHFEVLSLPLSVPLISLRYLVCTGHNTPPKPVIFGYVIVGSMPDITGQASWCNSHCARSYRSSNNCCFQQVSCNNSHNNAWIDFEPGPACKSCQDLSIDAHMSGFDRA